MMPLLLIARYEVEVGRAVGPTAILPEESMVTIPATEGSVGRVMAYLSLGRKKKHPGFSMWKGCLKGNRRSWKQMAYYNRGDVVLLEKLYLRLRSWAKNPVALPKSTPDIPSCKTCNSEKFVFQRELIKGNQLKNQYQCTSCRGHFFSPMTKRLDLIRDAHRRLLAKKKR
jgi:hypothetical protein